MSVIVTGMDMPERCIQCSFHNNSNDYCKIKYEFASLVKGKNDCPLKSIDGLIEKIKEMPNRNPSYSHTCDVVDREDLIEIIKEYCEV
jgi:hypothetical protein